LSVTKTRPREGWEPPQGWRLIDLTIAGSLTILSFTVYLFTMSRSIPYIDGGELTTVLWTLGIAHPTGYPLFTLLGFAFVHIPIFSEVALRANFFAVACTATAGGTFYFVFSKALCVLCTLDATTLGKNKKQKQSRYGNSTPLQATGLNTRLAAILGTLMLIFSRTFWEQSTSIEVYPLQLLLFATILILWLNLYENPSRSRSLFSGLVLGLGFTNHMTTILIMPGLIFLFISSYRRKSFDLKYIYWIIVGGALAGLLYLYLPIRASQNPLLDWGNPDNLRRFIRHVSGKQFRTWMFSSSDVFQKQLGVFFSSLYREFRITIILVIIGIASSLLSTNTFGSYRKYFWFCLILLVSDLLYAANYDIHDIASYFLLAYIALSFFSAIGFRWLIETISHRTRMVIPAAAIFLAFPVISAFANYDEVDASKDYSVEHYTKDILSALPPNSIVLSYQWDNFVSASLYYQNVDKIRKDIIVIDKELLRRSWYAAQVHNRFSFLFLNYDRVYNLYQDNLKVFENDLPYDPNSIELSYHNFIREIITGAMQNGRQVFAGPEIEDQYLSGFNKVPYGLLFAIRTDTGYVPFNVAGLNGFQAAKNVGTDYSRQIIGFYERMFLARAAYEYRHEKLSLTMICLNKALEVDPASQAARMAELQVSQELGRK